MLPVCRQILPKFPAPHRGLTGVCLCFQELRIRELAMRDCPSGIASRICASQRHFRYRVRVTEGILRRASSFQACELSGRGR